MGEDVDYSEYGNLDFEGFRVRAKNGQLSRHEKVGFPDHYREGKEQAIFEDVLAKLPQLQGTGKVVLEIGPGCSLLPVLLAELCERQKHTLIFIDSPEMLALLPTKEHVKKIPGRYPDLPDFVDQYRQSIDAIIAYSVIQYVFAEGNLWSFLDRSLTLLREGGQILLGDIPNVSMRKRFFSSSVGIAHHMKFAATDHPPEISFNTLEPGKIDDGVLLGLLARARAGGFNAWILPQSPGLPMANRREDLLIQRP